MGQRERERHESLECVQFKILRFCCLIFADESFIHTSNSNTAQRYTDELVHARAYTQTHAYIAAYATIQAKRKLGKTFPHSTSPYIHRLPKMDAHGLPLLGTPPAPSVLSLPSTFLLVPHSSLFISLYHTYTYPYYYYFSSFQRTKFRIKTHAHKISCLVPKISFLLQYLP